MAPFCVKWAHLVPSGPMQRPRIRGDLVDRAAIVRGEVAFDRASNRIYEAGLDAKERHLVASNPELRARVNELRAASLEAGDVLAIPID
jgi:hypothetical protein